MDDVTPSRLEQSYARLDRESRVLCWIFGPPTVLLIVFWILVAFGVTHG